MGQLGSGMWGSTCQFSMPTCHIYGANVCMPFSAILAMVLVAQWQNAGYNATCSGLIPGQLHTFIIFSYFLHFSFYLL